jgi:hypothetical protein
MFLPRMTRFIQNLVSLLRRQPFVPQVNRQPRQFTQLRGKGLRLHRLRAHLARDVQRIPNHNPHNRKSPRQSCQRAQILPRTSPPFQRQHRLRSQSQLVRHSNPDAAIADVKAEIAWLRFQRGLLAFLLQLSAYRHAARCAHCLKIPGSAAPNKTNLEDN